MVEDVVSVGGVVARLNSEIRSDQKCFKEDYSTPHICPYVQHTGVLLLPVFHHITAHREPRGTDLLALLIGKTECHGHVVNDPEVKREMRNEWERKLVRRKKRFHQWC